MLLRLARWQVALKAAEGSTSSDVLENDFGVSTASSTHKRDPSFVTPSLLPRHDSDLEAGTRRGMLDGDFLTD